MRIKAQIMSSDDIRRTLVRLSHQIIEKNSSIEDFCLIGIKTRGVPLARRIAENIRSITGCAVNVGELDITLYRDDLSTINVDPVINQTNVPFSIEGKTVVLVDDVIYTCRTARAAMDALKSIGRARRIQLCVLIDRGHAELPIRATFVGKNIPTSHNEVVCVNLMVTDGVENVVIKEK